mmetsp:Transcript_34438/g.102882  ORF Transcript_34438/g.102882 Transcript_34438/m.102882 type:complete len:187 (-) Transcript_34438:2110-2670(-)
MVGLAGSDSATSGSLAMSSACVPHSTTRPWSTTTMASESRMVLSRCAITSAEPRRARLSNAVCTLASFSLSSALVASSSRITSGRRSIARAMASRWRWPPERFDPPDSSIVNSLSGFSLMNSHACASLQACTISRSLTSRSMPYVKLAAIVWLNRTVDWSTITTRERRKCTSYSWIGTSSSRIVPR